MSAAKFETISELRNNFKTVNSKIPQFLKFNVDRVTSVSWAQSLKTASFLKESIFINLFNNSADVDNLRGRMSFPLCQPNLNFD
jgi:hypothetical protein